MCAPTGGSARAGRAWPRCGCSTSRISSQRRTGALAAVYRYFGKNLKVGAGYNFTDFSDDLTDLSYDHQGAFFNIVGSR